MSGDIRMHFGKLDGESYLTVEDFAELVCSTPGGVYKRIDRGNAPRVTRDGRNVRFRVADVREWLASKVGEAGEKARLGRPRQR